MSRPHHYYFVHKGLRDLFFNDPLVLLSVLDEQKEDLLKKIWADAGNMVIENIKDAEETFARWISINHR